MGHSNWFGKNKQRGIVKMLMAVLVLLLVGIAIGIGIGGLAHTASAGEVISKQKILRQTVRPVRDSLRSWGIPADFYIYEDGSWHLHGCLPDAICNLD